MHLAQETRSSSSTQAWQQSHIWPHQPHAKVIGNMDFGGQFVNFVQIGLGTNTTILPQFDWNVGRVVNLCSLATGGSQ
jgi:hypothetical protein